MTMPSAAAAPDEVVVRPRASLRMAVSLSVSLLGLAGIGWVLTPLSIRVLFTGLQIATLLLFLAIMVGMAMAIGLSVVRADADGLRFRNGVRSHTVAWPDVKAIRYRDGDPWAYVVVRTEVEQLPLLGIQRSDGERAEEAVAALRAMLVRAYGVGA